MCGIAGIYCQKGIKSESLTLILSALRHRGPDGYGYMLFSEKRGMRVIFNEQISACLPTPQDIIGFAHSRLSVIDLSDAGLQPMKDESNAYCVVYNGEIYNYLDLRKELQTLGYSFKTNTDTEVLIRAYEAWGPDCVKRFNGMWAFALLDLANNCLVISRDRFGIKPLYYLILDNTLYFASEIKGLLNIPNFNWKPNEKTVAKYLLTGLVDNSEETFFNGIFQFPAAHWVRIPLNSTSLIMKPEPYWLLPEKIDLKKEEEAIKELRELFLDSVRIHAQSDVPVGTCLSGGLDSSAIVCASEQLRKRFKIPNYTHTAFGYLPSDEKYSEKKYMDEVVKATGVKMNRIEFSQDQFVSRLPSIIQAQDEPFSSASIAAQWFVFQKAKESGMTVMLDGQGSDEILGGYHSYFITIALNLLRKRKILSYLRLRSKYVEAIGEFPLPYNLFTLGIIILLFSYPSSKILPPAINLYKRIKKNQPITREKIPLTRTLIEKYPFSTFTNKTFHSLNEELKLNLQATSLPALLRYEDRNSMAHSIEARVPFLDYRLVEFAFSIPEEFKIKEITTKYIFREAMKDILPESIRSRRDKLGFKPDPGLTFNFAKKYKNSMVKNRNEFEQRWFNEKGVEKILNMEDWSVTNEFLIWRIINTKLWIRKLLGEIELIESL